MSGPADDWSPEQLREALVAAPGMSPVRAATITAERLGRAGPDGAGVLVEIAVDHSRCVERWRLTFDSMWSDLCDFPLPDAALIVRANIVEWWDTRGQGSRSGLAAHGTDRLSRVTAKTGARARPASGTR